MNYSHIHILLIRKISYLFINKCACNACVYSVKCMYACICHVIIVLPQTNLFTQCMICIRYDANKIYSDVSIVGFQLQNKYLSYLIITYEVPQFTPSAPSPRISIKAKIHLRIYCVWITCYIPILLLV